MNNEDIRFKNWLKIIVKNKWILLFTTFISLGITLSCALIGKSAKPPEKKFSCTAVIQNGFICKNVLEKNESFEIIKNADLDLADYIQFEDVQGTQIFRAKIIDVNDGMVAKFKSVIDSYLSSGEQQYKEQLDAMKQQLAAIKKHELFYSRCLKQIRSLNLELSKFCVGEALNCEGNAECSSKCNGYIENLRCRIYLKEIANGVESGIFEATQKANCGQMDFLRRKPFKLISFSSKEGIPAGNLKRENRNNVLISLLFGFISGIIVIIIKENWAE